MKKLKVLDLDFEIYLEEKILKEQVTRLAKEIYLELNGKIPHFVAVLNGSFVFASDLLRAYPVDCKISFVKLSSYDGMVITGKVNIDTIPTATLDICIEWKYAVQCTVNKRLQITNKNK